MLEVIGISKNDVEQLNNSNANQMEYCIELEKDGLSPSLNDLKNIAKDSNIKLRVMVRNHWDTFEISDNQVDENLKYIRATKDMNIDGYVWGAITSNKEIDYQNLEKILKAVGNKNITFHKAIDHVNNVSDEFIKLMKYRNIKYVLTAGGLGNPLDNIDFFKNLPSQYKDRVLVGGGVNEEVINELTKLGYKNFHVGRLGREDKTYKKGINTHKVNELVRMINE